MNSQPAPVLFSTVFGVLMVVASAGPGAAVRVAVALALLAVVAGAFYRPATVVAVLATVAALALSDPPLLSAAVCGLSATAYLVIRHAVAQDGASDVVTTTAPTVLGMLGFTAGAVIAGLMPWRLAWVALLAPVVVVGIVVAAGAGLFRPDPVRYE